MLVAPTPLQLAAIPHSRANKNAQKKRRRARLTELTFTVLNILELRRNISRFLFLRDQIRLCSCTKKWTDEYSDLAKKGHQAHLTQYKGFVHHCLKAWSYSYKTLVNSYVSEENLVWPHLSLLLEKDASYIQGKNQV